MASNLVVVGQGAAGLSAALSAAANGSVRSLGLCRSMSPLSKRRPLAEQAGGNTRWTPAYMRMAAPEHVEPGSCTTCSSLPVSRATKTTSRGSPPTRLQPCVDRGHGVEFHQPVYYLAKGPPRIQPVGGGEAIHRVLSRAAAAAGVAFRYSCAVEPLVAEDGARPRASRRRRRAAASQPMRDPRLRRLPGRPRDDARAFRRRRRGVPLLAPRARFNSGDGIRMALALGADVAGDWNGMHAEPVDPRARTPRRSCWSIPTASWSTKRPPLLRRGRRPRARDLGGVRAASHFDVPGPQRLRDPRPPAVRDRRTGSAPSAPKCRRIEADTLVELARTDRRRCRRSAAHGRGLQRRLHRRSATIRRHALRRPCGARARLRRRNRTGRARSPSRRFSPGR